jgi:Ca2+-binding RTX toxin-like protein
MGSIALLALLSGLLLTATLSSDDDDTPIDTPEEPETPVDPDDPDTPVDPEEPETPPDTGATFDATEQGVQIELGEDETGSLAVIYYTDTEDSGNPDDYLQVDEARFYLVPEGVDWSSASWETQFDIPGGDSYGGPPSGYELADFEEENGLELLGVVDLLGVPHVSEDPSDRIGEITANAPVAGYYLEANTDGDELVTFLPQDYVVTREGVPELPVFEDTTGTEETDWLSADADGITVDGADGDDILETDNDDVTLIGGLGDDTIEARGDDAIIHGGEGNDMVQANSATVEGGAGDDSLTIVGGTANGGDGNDQLNGYGEGPNLLRGEAGDDRLYVSGIGSEAFGGAGDDFLNVNNGTTGHGDAGNDTLQVALGGTAFGGDGDDHFTLWNQFRDSDGAAVITGGAGADTIDARVWNAGGGEADDFYLRMTDFDPAEDVLQVGTFQTGNAVDAVELIEAPDGSHTDVRITFTPRSGGSVPGIAVIRLEGTTGMTADQVIITS